MNTYKINLYDEEYELAPIKESYARDNSLAILLYDVKNEEEFTTLTVNLTESILLRQGHAFVDTNNNSWAEKFIKDNKLGKPTGKYAFSGYCKYPEYKFDLEKLN